MKISIVTATYNSAETLKDTIESVLHQDYQSVEHILVDGASKDCTVDIIKAYPHIKKWVSEKDSGLYEAMNKGIMMADGDVVGTLNSNDFFPNSKVLSSVAKEFENENVDAVIGDIAFVNPDNLRKVIRHYSGRHFHVGRFAEGYMPPHPSFYVRRKFYLEHGLYKLDYKIAADYELLIRFLYSKSLRFSYIPEIMVYMRTGGVSNQSIRSRFILNKEIIRACEEYGIKTNMFRLSLKYFNKVFEYITPILNRGKR